MPRYIDADKVIELIRNYGKDAVDQGRKSLDPIDADRVIELTILYP